MNKKNTLQELVAETDIYLLDQIMKGRYAPDNIILDAGCGNGRNLYWFLQNHFNIYALDINAGNIAELKNRYKGATAEKFVVCAVEQTGFPDDHFHHIICSAVLHFAKSPAQFNRMMTELTRILKPGGSLFIRMASDIGMESVVTPIHDGVYCIPDGTERFLLNRSLLAESMQQHHLSLLEPLKTVNVNDIRCMSTLVLQKN